jgi:hypothetical protein
MLSFQFSEMHKWKEFLAIGCTRVCNKIVIEKAGSMLRNFGKIMTKVCSLNLIQRRPDDKKTRSVTSLIASNF